VQELTFHTAFLRGAAIHPDKVAVIDGDHQATHAEHRDRALRLCAVLRDLDIGPDDRFAVLSGNNHAYLELWHAAGLGAGVINPLNIRLSPVELAYILRDSGTDVVFCDATYLPVVELLQADGVKLREVVLVGQGGRYEQLLADAEPWLPAEPAEDDLCILMYTGGTTGLPKGVALTHRNLALCLYHMTMSFKLDDSFRFLIFLAMFHVAGSLGIFGPWAGGGTVVMMPAFEPGAVLDAIEQHAITDCGFVPTMLAMILQHPDFRAERLGSLRSVGYGAAPMPQGLLTQLLTMYPDMGIYQGYGMTEATGVITYLSPTDHRLGGDRLRSVGLPMAGVRFSIRGPEGGELPAGEIGEVCLRGGTVMREYWGQPEATADALRDGWYHSGDAGYLDDGGYLFLVDRVKDMIVSGGENVYSSEVENALSTHPAVGSVAVIGVPHDVWGEAVHAIVVVRADAEVTEDELKDHARLTLAGYKVPKTIELRDEPLPLSAAGKVLKRELRRPYWES
jgi:acyl-CoA synthetase (AMP-forming)/AMP-acid ligase II